MAISPRGDANDSGSSKPQPLVVTLEAREGNRFSENGECIGTHLRSIVFLPRGAVPGKTYRLELTELTDQSGQPRTDRGGKVMYRSRPASVEYFERWRDNGDGSASRVTFSRNWKLEEDEEGVSETRPLVTREGVSRQSTTMEVVWGAGLADTLVRQSTATTIPEIQEKIEDEKLVERETGTRDGGTTHGDYQVVSVVSEVYQSGWTKSWWLRRLELVQDDEAGVHISLTYGVETSHRHSAFWKDLPTWVQVHLMVPYPACPCSRERVDTPAGKSVCSQCEKEQGQIELIELNLPLARRQQIAREAALCLSASDSGQAFEGTTGWELLQALMHDEPHASSDWKGYPWYYLTTEGFYASRFPPVAMMILSNLGSARDQGLVRLTAWLPGEPSLHRCEAIEGGTADFYERTQVRAQSEEPTLDYRKLRGACVVVRLCGTRAQRNAAVEAVRAYKARGGESRELDSLLARHEYDGAIAKVSELEACLADRRRQKELLDTEYGVCPACKREWQTRRRSQCCDCLRDVYPPENEDIPLKKTVAPGGQVQAEVVWSADGRVYLRVHTDSTPADATTRIVWAPTETELTSWERLRDARIQASALETERNRAQGDYATRVRLTWDRQFSQGRLFAIVAMRGFDVSWMVDDHTDTFTGEVRFVCDPNRCKWLDEQGISRPRPGETWYCSWRHGTGGAEAIGRDRKGRPIVIANPQVPDDPDREARLAREVEEAEAAVAQAKTLADSDRSSGTVDLSQLLAKFGQH